MNLTGLTDPQKRELVDLLVLGTYADHHLATAEDERMQTVLNTIPFASDYERSRFLDERFTKMGRKRGNPYSIRSSAKEIANEFPKREDRNKASAALDELLASDNKTSEQERALFDIISEVFRA